MTDDANAFVLKARMFFGPPSPVLTGMQVHGRLDAVTFDLTLRQTYRNSGDRVVEVVYTFPLPATATLLGFASELNGQRRSGFIVGKAQAEAQYETAMEAGDAPVMLETQGPGIHTANIGNLKPGDEIVIEVRMAQLLRFEHGRLRLAIPTTIAPRYGNPAASHLQPQQVPQPSVEAEYPLSLSLSIDKAWSSATLECPTHRMATRREADGSTVLSLPAGARLDRDVVVTVTPPELRSSLLVQAADPFDADAPRVAVALLQPTPKDSEEGLAIKLLIDCSPSMAGDSITAARVALRGVLGGVASSDTLSLTRFGLTAEQLCEPSTAQPQLLRHLAGLVEGLQADIGGTDIANALRSVFPLQLPCGRRADILLITDGEIWDVDELVATARRGGQRVFVIGVGASPAEDVLRLLAESTGGACEFVTPGEALMAASLRMLQRMRQPRYANARIEWGGAPVWTAQPTAAVFGGDTVVAFAGLRQALDPAGVRLIADDAKGHSVELARVDRDMTAVGDSLPHLAAAQRLASMEGAPALALALAYQLLSRQTHAILVHERAQADKAEEAASLMRVSPMLAAGWGGFGSVAGELAARLDGDLIPSIAACSWGSEDAFDMSVPMFADRPPEPPVDLATLVRFAVSHVQLGRGPAGLDNLCDVLKVPAEVTLALDEMVKFGIPRHVAWLLLTYWASMRARPAELEAAADALRPWVKGLDDVVISQGLDICDVRLERHLGVTPSAAS